MIADEMATLFSEAETKMAERKRLANDVNVTAKDLRVISNEITNLLATVKKNFHRMKRHHEKICEDIALDIGNMNSLYVKRLFAHNDETRQMLEFSAVIGEWNYRKNVHARNALEDLLLFGDKLDHLI